MTRTARSKHWRRARVQPDPILQADLRGRRRGYRFSGQFSGARLDCEPRKGNDIHSIRANPILLRSQDRPCLPLGIPFLEIARFRLAARSSEPRISAGTFSARGLVSHWRAVVRFEDPEKPRRGCWISTWWLVHSRRAPCAGVADGRLSDEQDEGGRTQPRAGPRFTSMRRAPSSPVDSTF